MHEYLHKLSIGLKENRGTRESYNLYKEMIPILGEFRFLNYLEKQSMISKYELELLRDVRKKRYYRNAICYLVCEPLVNTFLKTGELTEKSIRGYTSFEFSNDAELEYVIKNFQQTPSLAYRYLLGTPLAATLCGISSEEFKTLIENLNKVEIEEYNQMVSNLSNKKILSSMKRQFERNPIEKIKRR